MLNQELDQEDIPAGYQTSNNSTLTIHKPHAAIVRDLFQDQIEKSTPKRVFIYARVAAQDDKKLEEQVKACFNFCQEKGYRGVDTFQTNGVSGNTLDNEVLSRMYERYNEVDAIVVLSPDRLTRDVTLYQTLVQEMQQHHVELICVNEQQDR